MSNIFEALKRAEQENPDIAPPFIIEEEAKDGAPPKSSEPPDVFIPPVASAIQPSLEQIPAPKVKVEVDSDAEPSRTMGIRIVAGVPILPFDGSDPGAGEQYRILRTKLIQHPRQPKLCVITSPGPGDGKTITAINLAGALALRSDAKVVLIDGDLRRSNIAAVLGIPEGPGLAELLAGVNELDDVLIRVEQLHNLYIIPAGKPCANPTELLDPSRLSSVTKRLREAFRFAIMDVPPIASVADYDLIQAQSDGVLMVMRQDYTNRSSCFKAIEMIPKDKMLGVVLNCVKEWFLWKTHNYYYYSGHKREKMA